MSCTLPQKQWNKGILFKESVLSSSKPFGGIPLFTEESPGTQGLADPGSFLFLFLNPSGVLVILDAIP